MWIARPDGKERGAAKNKSLAVRGDTEPVKESLVDIADEKQRRVLASRPRPISQLLLNGRTGDYGLPVVFFCFAGFTAATCVAGSFDYQTFQIRTHDGG